MLPSDNRISQYSVGEAAWPILSTITTSFLKLHPTTRTLESPRLASVATRRTSFDSSPGSLVHNLHSSVDVSNPVLQMCLLSSAQIGRKPPLMPGEAEIGLPSLSRKSHVPPLALRPIANVCPSGAMSAPERAPSSFTVALGAPDQSKPVSQLAFAGSWRYSSLTPAGGGP